MASIINADDGVISGVAGVKTTADTSGVLNIQTNGVTAISISASQVVSFPATTSVGTVYFGDGSASAPSIGHAGDTNTGIYFPGADQIAITTGGTQRFVVDASGNAGLGVTPKSWSAGISVFQYGNRGTLIANDSVASYGYNAYYDGADKYIASAAAADHLISGSVHYLRSAPSGTAGNALTWTNVLSVDKDKSLALQGATSQSGTGITFPATQSASSNANTLDDYEEGTWTPTFAGETTAGTTTYLVQRGGYIKIGSMVTVWCDVAVNTATGTGNVLIGGLPFTSISDVNFQSTAPLMVDSVDWNAGTYLQAYLYGSTSVRIYYMTDNVTWAQQQVNNEFQEYIFTMNYRVA